MKTVTIHAGTRLYRCAPRIEKTMRQCKDTGKTGIYFSTYQLQALAMCVEYGRSMRLGVFEVTDDIVVTFGKYNFRDLNPERYYMWNFWCIKIPFSDKECHPDENVSHFDNRIQCILGLEYDWNQMFRDLTTESDGELFIGKQEHLDRIELLEVYQVPLKGLHDVFSKNRFITNSPEYLLHCVPCDKNTSKSIF